MSFQITHNLIVHNMYDHEVRMKIKSDRFILVLRIEFFFTVNETDGSKYCESLNTFEKFCSHLKKGMGTLLFKDMFTSKSTLNISFDELEIISTEPFSIRISLTNDDYTILCDHFYNILLESKNLIQSIEEEYKSKKNISYNKEFLKHIDTA